MIFCQSHEISQNLVTLSRQRKTEVLGGKTKLFQVCTSSGGWNSKADENGRIPYPWSNEYLEGDTAAPNGTVVGSSAADKASNQHQHRLAEKVDSKDIERAEHV